MYDPAHARSRTVQPMGGNLKPDLTLKTCLVYYRYKHQYQHGGHGDLRSATQCEVLKVYG